MSHLGERATGLNEGFLEMKTSRRRIRLPEGTYKLRLKPVTG